jgi:hypothetical protein
MSPAKFTSTHLYLDFDTKQVDVTLAGNIIIESTLNTQNNHQTYHCPCHHCHCILHHCCHSTSASTIICSHITPPHCCVPICLNILAIPLSSSSNYMAWIDFSYLGDVDTMDALFGLLEMVLVCFVMHMVDGFNVAMHIALTLFKIEDCASNMTTRCQLAAWMDAIIRALCMDFAKDMEHAIVVISSIAQRAYSNTTCANLIIL